MDRVIVGQSRNELGGFYLAKLGDGSWLAGRDEVSAKAFESARAVYNAHYYFAVNGSHGDWNICNHVQDYLED